MRGVFPIRERFDIELERSFRLSGNWLAGAGIRRDKKWRLLDVDGELLGLGDEVEFRFGFSIVFIEVKALGDVEVVTSLVVHGGAFGVVDGRPKTVGGTLAVDPSADAASVHRRDSRRRREKSRRSRRR